MPTIVAAPNVNRTRDHSNVVAWRCGESNPGLSACRADALPLCHIPKLDFLQNFQKFKYLKPFFTEKFSIMLHCAAPAGNRTRGPTMATLDFATKPLARFMIASMTFCLKFHLSSVNLSNFGRFVRQEHFFSLHSRSLLQKKRSPDKDVNHQK